MKNRILALACAALLSLIGCGEAEQPKPAVCVGGEEELCQCEGGLNGTRQCLPSTLGFTQCDCFGVAPDTAAPIPDGGTTDITAVDADAGDDSQGPEPVDAVDVLDDLSRPADTGPVDTNIEEDAPEGDIDAIVEDTTDVPDATLDAGAEDATSDTAEDAVSPPVNCETDVDCDDGNPCTDEVCMVTAGVCVYDDMWTDGFPCQADSNPCTQGDSCLGGECNAGEPLDCSAFDSECAIGVCVPAGPDWAECSVAPANEGFPCDDSSVCTTGDVCGGGLCMGDSVACENDDDPCTDAACDPETGCLQEESPDDTPCDDEDICTENDACLQGACGGTPVSCEADGNSCTLDLCAQEEGGCVHLNQPDGTLCQDGQGCTLNDTCTEGVCEPGELKSCDSGEPCMADLCDFVTGQCTSAPIVGCESGLLACDLTNDEPCAEGVCDPSTNACVPCLTAQDCGAAGLTCAGKQCLPAVQCDSVTSCAIVESVCDETTGVCVGCLTSDDCAEGLSCSVGVCQEAPPVICTEGACLGLTHVECNEAGTAYLVADTSCDDEELCTDDYCSATQGCVHTNNQDPCDDSDACTSDDTCSFGSCTGAETVICVDDNPCDGTHTCDAATGACVNGDPLLCDDSQPCNGVEACDPATGGCLPGDPIACEDGDLCNGIETCDAESGQCSPGEAVDCDDGLQCNGAEACVPETGLCADGVPLVCSDGDACNGFETCDPISDECAPGAPVVCSDGDPCNGVEECYGPGFCTAPEDVICADADLCNGEETCDPASGLCLDGVALDCDDLDPCTNDYCTAEIGCSHIYIPACDDGLCDDVDCADEGPCVDNTCNPSNGLCEASPTDCDDLDPCTTDSCDPDAGEGENPCVHTLDTECVPCTANEDCVDDDPCTADQCDPVTAVCDFTTPVTCDDDNDCSADSCVPESGCVFEVIKPCPGLDCAFDFECSNDSTCTVDTCEIAPGAATGDCVHTSIECDDGDPCHTGSCDPDVGIAGGCVFADKDCDDGNFCTLDSCGSGPEGGCAHEENPCDDADPCTSDSCDALTQECENIAIPDCAP